MFRPSAAWVIVDELDDFSGTVGMAEIHRADRFVVLCIDTTLRLRIDGLGAILLESRERRTKLLVLERQHAFVEKRLRVIGINMLLR